VGIDVKGISIVALEKLQVPDQVNYQKGAKKKAGYRHYDLATNGTGKRFSKPTHL
jgi:hypothetical protein